jgi:hypothetical protein
MEFRLRRVDWEYRSVFRIAYRAETHAQLLPPGGARSALDCAPLLITADVPNAIRHEGSCLFLPGATLWG